MHLLIRSHRFLFITIFLSIVFWFVESSLHFLVFNQEDHFEIIPHDFNELWMRIVICILIIVTGSIADMYIRTLHKVQEEKLRIETEKFRVGRSTNLLVAQAQRDLLLNRINEVNTIVDYLKALTSFYRLEGSLLERRGIEAPGREPVDDPG